jgi:transmembrane sensor
MSRSDTPPIDGSGGNVLAFPERTPIEEEAARWVIRLEDALMTAAERAEFEAWRAASSLHADAFNRMRDTWRDLDALAQITVADPQPAAAGHRVMLGGLALAAAALVAAVVAGLQLRDRPSLDVPPAGAIALYETDVGAQERIDLTDGSVITLNTGSRVEVRYASAERGIRLVEGEAFFDVAADPGRPFRVYAGEGVAAAVGTAFSVRLQDDGIELVVSEGTVSFAAAAQAAQPVAYVAAGQTASFRDRVNIIETIEAQEVDRKLSWTAGRLVFAGEPLSQVVADISRYTSVNISFANEDVANLPVGGYFDVGEVDRLLEALETSFALRVERVDDRNVRILGPQP